MCAGHIYDLNLNALSNDKVYCIYVKSKKIITV